MFLNVFFWLRRGKGKRKKNQKTFVPGTPKPEVEIADAGPEPATVCGAQELGTTAVGRPPPLCYNQRLDAAA